MTFELTINRVGAFLESPHLAADAARDALRDTLRLVAKPSEERRQRDAIAAQARDFACIKRDTKDAELNSVRIREFVGSENDKGPKWTIIGTLPTRAFCFTTSSPAAPERRAWNVHARPSITVCAYERTGFVKLWWTFEGVPANDDPRNRPQQEDITAYINATDEMANAAMDPLFESFTYALSATLADKALTNEKMTLSNRRIRVRMSDSNHFDVEALLDARLYLKQPLADIRTENSHAWRGLKLLEDFANSTSKTDLVFTDRDIATEDGFDGLNAVFLRVPTKRNLTIGDVTLVGFGHQSGSVSGLERVVEPEHLRIRKQDKTLRALSASRPISALIADRESSLSNLRP